MKCTCNATRTAAAILAGIAIGGALGMLFAPAKGCDTRKRLANQMDETDELRESLKEKFSKLVDDLKKDLETAKH